MADRFYGVTLNQQIPSQVVEGASTGGASATVELRVNDTAYTNKIKVILAVENLLNYLRSSKETSPIA